MESTSIGAGLACFADYSVWQALDRAADLGFQSVELLGVSGSRHSVGLLPGMWLDELTTEEMEQLRSALGRFAHFSVHAPFVDAPLFTYNRGIARESLRQVTACIQVAGRLGARAVAVHANQRAFLTVRDYWDDMVAVFRALGDAAAEANVVVGLETGFPNSYGEFVELIRAIDHPRVGATIDIGHVAFMRECGPRSTEHGIATYNRLLVDLCHELGERVVHMHIHDVDPQIWRDHRELGTGMVDLTSLFAALEHIGYNGLLQLELEESDREGALLRSKALLERQLGSIIPT
jgi:sugar phosphate isomerase/epimerase